MDACEKIWFGNVVTYLHLAVDKGTKKVLFGWFEYEELTRGYFVLLYNIIINYGIPEKIKADILIMVYLRRLKQIIEILFLIIRIKLILLSLVLYAMF